MLAYILAIAVGLGSLAIYIAAFFFPEVHRKSDFLWSGLGLFYALILWTCAGRITGAVLLGQMASVGLIGWFGWQTMSLRRQVTPVAEQTKIPTKETGKSLTKPPTETTPRESISTGGTPTIEEETPAESTSVAEFSEVPKASWETEVPTVVQTPTPRESATTETLKNLTQPSETETEINSELETPAVGEATVSESEVNKTQTTTKDSFKKKAGGISILLTPVNELVSSIKNAFGKKDLDKVKTKTVSTETPQAKLEKETETPEVETEVNVTEKEEEGIAEVEIKQKEEVKATDGEEEKAIVVEKETQAKVDLSDSSTDTPEVTFIEEEVSVTTGEIEAEETVSETESKEEFASLEEREEVEDIGKPTEVSSELPSVSNQDSDSEKNS